MGAVFDPATNFLGITPQLFEILFSSIFVLLLLLSFVLFLSLRRQRQRADRSRSMARKLGRDIEASQGKLKASEDERLNVISQHEEALAKLKEAKEVIIGQDREFKEFKAKFEGDFSKLSAMEDELKTYRIRLGELNKEKEKIASEFESFKQSVEKDTEKLKAGFERELVAEKKKINSFKQDFEEEIEKRERVHERRIEDVKSQTKDALSKVTLEKDREIGDLKAEAEKLEKQVDKLKEEIRVLEIDKL